MSHSVTLTSGVDVVSIKRIESLIEDFPDQFLAYAFANSEQEYCNSQYYPPEHFAARWAAKESIIKAYPTLDGADLQNIVIESTDSGPKILLKNDAKGRLTSPPDVTAGVDWSISLSHSRQLDLAIALVIGIEIIGNK